MWCNLSAGIDLIDKEGERGGGDAIVVYSMCMNELAMNKCSECYWLCHTC